MKKTLAKRGEDKTEEAYARMCADLFGKRATAGDSGGETVGRQAGQLLVE